MKLLLDENLSRRLVPFLQSDFPQSTQVALLGMARADDLAIWRHAKDNGYIIVTRDADFVDISTIHGMPPQVIWLRTPNQSKAAVLNLLIKHQIALHDALQEHGVACIELGPHGVES